MSAEVGPWSAPVVSNVPMDDNWHHQTWESGSVGDLRFAHSWTTHAYAGDFYGSEHTTTAATVVVGALTPFHGPRLVIFGMKCPHCGKFRIDMQGGRGGHFVTKPVIVDTYASTTRHRVVLSESQPSLATISFPGKFRWDFQWGRCPRKRKGNLPLSAGPLLIRHGDSHSAFANCCGATLH